MNEILRRVALASCVLVWGASAALAETRTIYLEDAGGSRIAIADLHLAADEGSYELVLRTEPFTDHFLSMRPFKCIEGPQKHWCHVPYPYQNARDLADELTDLEYDLLFLWKGAGDYGITMWNGVYYRLQEQSDGRITGALHEMNMDILAVPPEPGELRPIRDADLEPGDPDSHWLPRVVIE